MSIDLEVRDDLPSFSYSQTFQPVVSYGESLAMLERLTAVTGLTRSKLGKLLGSGGPVVFNWYAGRRTPSQPYCMRIIHLLLWALEGVPLAMVRTVNWNTLEIEWLKGCEPVAERPDDIPESFRAVPDPQSEAAA